MDGAGIGSVGALAWMLAAVLAKSGMLLLFAWATASVMHRRSAAVRAAIWRYAIAACLILPVVLTVVPPLQVPSPWPITGEEASEKGYLIARPSAAPSAGDIQVPHREASRPLGREVIDIESGVFASEAHAVAEMPAGRKIALAMLLIWIAGVILLGARIFVDVLRIARITNGAIPWTDMRTMRELKSVVELLEVDRPIRLLRCAHVEIPVTWGALRPAVLLPSEALEWSRKRLRAVLLHEAAHIRRRDYAAQLLSEISCAIYWPNPLVWVARRRMQYEQEHACDDLVIAVGMRSYEYAEHLVQIAMAATGDRWSWRGAIGMGRPSTLKNRIKAILDARTDRTPISTTSAFIVALLLVAVTILIASVAPGAAQEHAEHEPVADLDAPDTRRSDARQLSTPEDIPPNVHIWLEAEEGAVTAPMIIEGDADASGVRAVSVPDGPGNDPPGGGPGSVVLNFEIPREGEYAIWARVIGPGSNDNSFFVSVDQEVEFVWHVLDESRRPLVASWQWLQVGLRSDAARAKPETYLLSAGGHALTFRNREDGTRLDRILITDDLSFHPSGRGPLPDGLPPVHLWFEAESAVLEGPMQRLPDPRASGQRFAAVAPDLPDGEGSVLVHFDVAHAGTYIVWARVRAPRTDQNSFFLSLDGAQEILWDVPGPGEERTTERWTWDAASPRGGSSASDPERFELSAGRHMLRIRSRESGTSVDGILITNDLGYRPQGIPSVSPPLEPAYAWIEAEEAAIRDPEWEIRNVGSEMDAALVVSRDRRSLDAPPSGGRALYAFDVPHPGRYSVWGRVLAPSAEQNSFWVRIDGGRWIKWNNLGYDPDWIWVDVRDDDYGDEPVRFDLASGPHTLEIAYREGGTSLDRVLITNDPWYAPSDEGFSVAGDQRVKVYFDDGTVPSGDAPVTRWLAGNRTASPERDDPAPRRDHASEF